MTDAGASGRHRRRQERRRLVREEFLVLLGLLLLLLVALAVLGLQWLDSGPDVSTLGGWLMHAGTEHSGAS